MLRRIIIYISLLFSFSLSAEQGLTRAINEKYQSLTQDIQCATISANEALSLKQNEYILVDVRSKKEQQVSMLPNAISDVEFLKNTEKFKDRKIIAYCTIGYRSALFAEKLKKLKIVNLIGGVLAWSHIHGTFTKDGKITKKVHTYSKKWNLLNKKYHAVYD